MKGIAKTIEELREQRGLSKKEFAELCGINPSVIWRISKSGKADLASLEKIAKALDVDVTYLLTPPELRTKATPPPSEQKYDLDITITIPLTEYNKLVGELAILREKSKKG